jgi:hypothetical protein
VGVRAHSVVGGLVFLKVGVFFVNSGKDKGHTTDASADVLLACAEVCELLGLSNSEDGQVFFELREVDQLQTLE